MTARLTLDGLDLMGIPDPRGFRLKALGSSAGTSWGTPEAVTETMDSFLADGAIVATTGHSTRELSLAVAVQAASSAGLAAGEAALIEACRKTWDPAGMIEATWTPPDGMAPTSVFEVVDAQLSQDLDDYSELKPDLLGRVYMLTLTAWPWSRSVEPTRISIPAPPATLIEETVDDGSSVDDWVALPDTTEFLLDGTSTSGWARTPSGWSLTTSGGAVRSAGTVPAGSGTYPVTLTRSGLSITVGTRPYLRVTTTPVTAPSGVSGWDVRVSPQIIVNGTVLSSIGLSIASSGALRTWVKIPGSIATITSIGVRWVFERRSSAYGKAVAFWNAYQAAAAATVGTPASVGGRVQLAVSELGVSMTSTPLEISAQLTRTGLSVDMTDTPYLRVRLGADATAGNPQPTLQSVDINGAKATVLATSGKTVVLDAAGIDTLTEVRAQWGLKGSGTNGGSGATVWIDDITATNAGSADVTTGRMSARTVPVQGVVRTPASLALHDDTGAGLGTTLVYTAPVIEGMALPPLRPYLTPGPSETPDGSTLSGATSDLSTTHVCEVPAASLQRGVHQLLARVKHASGGAKTIAWSTATLMGATSTPGQSGSVTVTLAADTWTLVPLGLAQLPDRAVGASGVVRVSLSSTSGVLLDDAFAANVDVGRLTWCECGEGAADLGGPSSWLWADAASLERPVPSVWVSASDNRADAMHAGTELLALGAHEFAPAQTLVWTATTGSTACAIDLEYWRRWHTHAAA